MIEKTVEPQAEEEEVTEEEKSEELGEKNEAIPSEDSIV